MLRLDMQPKRFANRRLRVETERCAANGAGLLSASTGQVGRENRARHSRFDASINAGKKAAVKCVLVTCLFRSVVIDYRAAHRTHKESELSEV